MSTFFVLWETEVAVPSVIEDHVIAQVFPLNLQLLHHDNVGLEDVEHGRERLGYAPWLISEGVADAVHVPCGESHVADMYILTKPPLHPSVILQRSLNLCQRQCQCQCQYQAVARATTRPRQETT